jgi:hypothetical protein
MPRGEPAYWMGARGSLASAHRSAPFGSWWTSVGRTEWGNAVHARWRGPSAEAPKESKPRLALLRRSCTTPVPPRTSKRSSRRKP